MPRTTFHISLVGVGVAGAICLFVTLVFAGALLALVVGAVFAVFCFGLVLRGLFYEPRLSASAWDVFMGVLGVGYATMIGYEIVVFRGGTSILMGALLVALMVGYAGHRRGV